jgi:hypothetical protein
MYECFAEHAMSSKEVMRDRRVARSGSNGGKLGEDIPLNNYIKSAEHYLACGVSCVEHLANICQSNHENILSAKIWILFVKTYPCLKTLHLIRTNNCLNVLDSPCMM